MSLIYDSDFQIEDEVNEQWFEGADVDPWVDPPVPVEFITVTDDAHLNFTIQKTKTFKHKAIADHVDGYSINADYWASGEEITAATITDSTGSLTIGYSTIVNGLISVLATGVSAGNATLHFELETATRSTCINAIVKVIADC